MVLINGFNYTLSNRKNKKLQVRVGNKVISFGDARYGHFRDLTGLLPSRMNHYDNNRRDNYLRRAEGQGTANDPYSANYHAMRILWGYL
jgi:hypothetical protein